MDNLETIEELSKKYSLSSFDFIKIGSSLAIKEKKRELQLERVEVLSRYDATNIDELKAKIEQGSIPEHPGWEDCIELENIEAEIKEIENDIRALQEA